MPAKPAVLTVIYGAVTLYSAVSDASLIAMRSLHSYQPYSADAGDSVVDRYAAVLHCTAGQSEPASCLGCTDLYKSSSAVIVSGQFGALPRMRDVSKLTKCGLPVLRRRQPVPTGRRQPQPADSAVRLNSAVRDETPLTTTLHTGEHPLNQQRSVQVLECRLVDSATPGGSTSRRGDGGASEIAGNSQPWRHRAQTMTATSPPSTMTTG
jgi:hypothetical protein